MDLGYLFGVVRLQKVTFILMSCSCFFDSLIVGFVLTPFIVKRCVLHLVVILFVSRAGQVRYTR